MAATRLEKLSSAARRPFSPSDRARPASPASRLAARRISIGSSGATAIPHPVSRTSSALSPVAPRTMGLPIAIASKIFDGITEAKSGSSLR